MRFVYAPLADQASGDAVFLRMEKEGLAACAMSSFERPSLHDWQRSTDPARGILLGCRAPACGLENAAPGALLACALFSPRRGRVWEFDFTTFRNAARQAVPMALGGLGWAFGNLDCAAVMGLCPAPNRHAWRLAEQCGFRVLGRLPGACLHARKRAWVDGVLVLCTPHDLELANA